MKKEILRNQWLLTSLFIIISTPIAFLFSLFGQQLEVLAPALSASIIAQIYVFKLSEGISKRLRINVTLIYTGIVMFFTIVAFGEMVTQLISIVVLARILLIDAPLIYLVLTLTSKRALMQKMRKNSSPKKR